MSIRGVFASAVACGVLYAAACSNPETERVKRTTQPTYDKETGRLTQLTYDRNKNGVIDTWTDMDGTRPLRSRIDTDEDGKIDRWEYYDDKGGLAKVGFSRRNDGKPDAWAYAGPNRKLKNGRAAMAVTAQMGTLTTSTSWSGVCAACNSCERPFWNAPTRRGR